MEWRAKNSTRFQLFRIRFGHVMEILHDISCNSLLYFEISAVGGTYCDNLTSHLTHFSNLFLQANIYWPKFSPVSLHLHQNLETLISSHWTRCFGHASQKTSTPPSWFRCDFWILHLGILEILHQCGIYLHIAQPYSTYSTVPHCIVIVMGCNSLNKQNIKNILLNYRMKIYTWFNLAIGLRAVKFVKLNIRKFWFLSFKYISYH